MKNPTHFWIFGATRYPRTPEMRFLFCSGLSIWQIRSFSDFGESGTALELGEDQGMEVPAKARGRLRSMSAPRLLWLSHFQYALSLRYRGLSSNRRANSKRARSCTGFFPACCQTWVNARAYESDGRVVQPPLSSFGRPPVPFCSSKPSRCTFPYL